MSEPAAPPPLRPTLAELFRAFVLVSHLRLRRRAAVGAAHDRRAQALDDRRGIQRGLRAVAVPAGAEHDQFLGGVRLALRRAAGAAVALAGLLGPPLVIVTVLAVLYERYGDIETLGRILPASPRRRSAC